jgi:hypothetical protein
MKNNQAVVTAVLTTVLRATADPSVPVVLRPGRTGQARDLAGWLERMHGSRRVVLVSPVAGGLIRVRLPSRIRWPDRSEVGLSGTGPLAHGGPPNHFTHMSIVPPPSGRR